MVEIIAAKGDLKAPEQRLAVTASRWHALSLLTTQSVRSRLTAVIRLTAYDWTPCSYETAHFSTISRPVTFLHRSFATDVSLRALRARRLGISARGIDTKCGGD